MLSLTRGLEAEGGDRAPDCTNSVTFGGFPNLGVPTIMENQMEKKMENNMETGII